MMQVLFTCDKCGAERKGPLDRQYDPLLAPKTYYAGRVSSNSNVYELCDECYKNYESAINTFFNDNIEEG